MKRRRRPPTAASAHLAIFKLSRRMPHNCFCVTLLQRCNDASRFSFRPACRCAITTRRVIINGVRCVENAIARGATLRVLGRVCETRDSTTRGWEASARRDLLFAESPFSPLSAAFVHRYARFVRRPSSSLARERTYSGSQRRTRCGSSTRSTLYDVWPFTYWFTRSFPSSSSPRYWLTVYS